MLILVTSIISLPWDDVSEKVWKDKMIFSCFNGCVAKYLMKLILFLQKHFVIYGKLRYNLMQGLHAPPFPIVSWRQSFVKPWSDSLHMNPAESITPAHWTQTNCWGNDAKDSFSVESRPELSSEESKQSGQPSSRHSFGIH